jgi:hypothetical protein
MTKKKEVANTGTVEKEMDVHKSQRTGKGYQTVVCKNCGENTSILAIQGLTGSADAQCLICGGQAV